MRNHLLLLSALMFLFSCKKESDDSKAVLPSNSLGYYVVNEGNFGWGNASLGFVNDSGVYFSNIFENANERKLGDVFQQMYAWNGKYFLVVNNSSKIEAIQDRGHLATFQVENLGSPRFMTVIGNKGYVGDLYSDAVTVFNLNDGSLIKTLNLGASLDRIYRTWAWGVCVANHKLYKIDSKSVEVVDSLDFDLKVLDAVSDEDSMLYVIGMNDQDSVFGLHLDPISLKIKDKIYLKGLLAKPNYLRANSSGVYMTSGNKLFTVTYSGNTPEWSSSDLPEVGNVYGFEVHPINGDYYFCDAKDYTQKGEIVILDANLNLKNKVSVGYIPNSVVFVNE